MAGLVPVVEFLAEPLADLLADLGGVDLGVEAPLQREQDAELGEVRLHRRLHVGVLELAGEGPAVMAGGAVDLAERGGGRRRLVEGREPRLPVRAEFRLHPALDEGRPHRRRGRLQRPELRGEFGRQQVRHGRENLGELHQRALEPAERRREVGRVLRIGQVAAHQPRAGDPRRDAADIGADPGIAPEPAGKAILFGVVLRHAGESRRRTWPGEGCGASVILTGDRTVLTMRRQFPLDTATDSGHRARRTPCCLARGLDGRKQLSRRA